MSSAERASAEDLLKFIERDKAERALLREGLPALGAVAAVIGVSIPDEIQVLRTILSGKTEPWVRGVLLVLAVAQYSRAGYELGHLNHVQKTETDVEKAVRLRTPTEQKLWPQGVFHASGVASTLLAAWARSGKSKRPLAVAAASLVVRNAARFYMRANQARFVDIGDALKANTRP